MKQLNGIYAASLSILKNDLSLDIENTTQHAENLIKLGCHGVVIFGSTGQAQLISLSEKIQLINRLSNSKDRDRFIIGTGLNSLSDTINLMNISKSLRLNKFLIMPPAYYKYNDNDVINFYSKIIENVVDCKIILYNFEKLSGYKFSIKCIEDLVTKFSSQIIGLKDSTYNLYDNLKIDNFSILPGSETKLLKGLEAGCTGIITATTNVTASLARTVYDNFINKKNLTLNKKLCDVRNAFDKFNLISALHTLLSRKNTNYKNILPPLHLLSDVEEHELNLTLKNLNFDFETLRAA